MCLAAAAAAAAMTQDLTRHEQQVRCSAPLLYDVRGSAGLARLWRHFRNLFAGLTARRFGAGNDNFTWRTWDSEEKKRK